MKPRKLMAMFTILIIALAIAGFVYATWRDSIKIEGEVHMGDFIVGWLDYYEAVDIDPKNVSEVLVSFDDEETGVHHVPVQTVYHTAIINITNASPCYEAFVLLKLKNAGTIPAHIMNVTVSGRDLVDAEDLVWVDADGDPVSTEGWFNDTNAGPGGTTAPVINLNVTKLTGDVSVNPFAEFVTLQYYNNDGTQGNVTCNQIEPCTWEYVLVWVDIKQDAQQCHAYEFTVTIEAAQWNWPILPD